MAIDPKDFKKSKTDKDRKENKESLTQSLGEKKKNSLKNRKRVGSLKAKPATSRRVVTETWVHQPDEMFDRSTVMQKRFRSDITEAQQLQQQQQQQQQPQLQFQPQQQQQLQQSHYDDEEDLRKMVRTGGAKGFLSEVGYLSPTTFLSSQGHFSQTDKMRSPLHGLPGITVNFSPPSPSTSPPPLSSQEENDPLREMVRTKGAKGFLSEVGGESTISPVTISLPATSPDPLSSSPVEAPSVSLPLLHENPPGLSPVSPVLPSPRQVDDPLREMVRNKGAKGFLADGDNTTRKRPSSPVSQQETDVIRDMVRTRGAKGFLPGFENFLQASSTSPPGSSILNEKSPSPIMPQRRSRSPAVRCDDSIRELVRTGGAKGFLSELEPNSSPATSPRSRKATSPTSPSPPNSPTTLSQSPLSPQYLPQQQQQDPIRELVRTGGAKGFLSELEPTLPPPTSPLSKHTSSPQSKRTTSPRSKRGTSPATSPQQQQDPIRELVRTGGAKGFLSETPTTSPHSKNTPAGISPTTSPHSKNSVVSPIHPVYSPHTIHQKASQLLGIPRSPAMYKNPFGQQDDSRELDDSEDPIRELVRIGGAKGFLEDPEQSQQNQVVEDPIRELVRTGGAKGFLDDSACTHSPQFKTNQLDIRKSHSPIGERRASPHRRNRDRERGEKEREENSIRGLAARGGAKGFLSEDAPTSVSPPVSPLLPPSQQESSDPIRGLVARGGAKGFLSECPPPRPSSAREQEKSGKKLHRADGIGSTTTYLLEMFVFTFFSFLFFSFSNPRTTRTQQNPKKKNTKPNKSGSVIEKEKKIREFKRVGTTLADEKERERREREKELEEKRNWRMPRFVEQQEIIFREGSREKERGLKREEGMKRTQSFEQSPEGFF